MGFWKRFSGEMISELGWSSWCFMPPARTCSSSCILNLDIIDLVGNHLDLYRKNQFSIGIEVMGTLSLEERDERLKHHLMASKDLHPALVSPECEYKVLQRLVGGLLAVARNGRLKEDEARKYFQQLVNAVDYCHSRGVSHRDLKPENLLLDVNGALKVSDFGLSALPQQVRDTIYQEHTISRDQVAEVVVEALVCEESLYKVVEIGTLPDAPSTLNQGSLCFNRATISLLDPP